MRSRSPRARFCTGVALALGIGVAADATAADPARAAGEGIFAVSCAQGYARAFGQINAAATELRLKADGAEAEVRRILRQPPARCEAGGYGYFLDQLTAFSRRALRSGATPQSPKEGWMRAAAAAAGFAPQRVPQAEYYDDMQRFQAARKEIAAGCSDAGLGPLQAALLSAFDQAAPVPGAYGPRPAPPAEAQVASPPGAGAPPPLAPAPPVTPPPPAAAAAPAQVYVPTVPLPDWAVVTLHQVLDLMQKGRDAEAQAKLDLVLRWVEAQR